MIKVKLGKAIPFMKGVMSAMQKDFRAQVGKDFGAAINTQIESGISPVSGQGRFVDYSQGYKNKIEAARGIAAAQKKYGSKAATPVFAKLGKRLRPVNLKLTGNMLKSQEVKVQEAGAVIVSYDDEKADYHNTQGAGKGKVLRRMLPTKRGEKFSTVLTRMLKDFAVKSAAKILRK